MKRKIAKVSLAKTTDKDGAKGMPFATQEQAVEFVTKKVKAGAKPNLWVMEEGRATWDKIGALRATARGLVPDLALPSVVFSGI